MINFCSSKYSELLGSHECDCGKTHQFFVRCLLEHGAFERMGSFLEGLTPPMSRVVLLYDDEQIMSEIYAHIKRDYRVVTVKADDDKKQIELVALPEDTKLIIAIGGVKAINAAKYKAYLLDIPTVIAALPGYGALSNFCVINDGGLYLTYIVNEPKGFIFDLDSKLSDANMASLFGTVAARLNSAFEIYAAALLNKSEFCPYIYGAISDIAAKTILDAAKMPFHALKDVLIESALKLALIGKGERGGEVQCALTYSMLSSSEFSLGELEFVFAAILSPLYKSHIMRRKSFMPPPDNNYRLAQIAEFFGISEHKAIRLILPQISGKEAAIAEYKIREYTKDLTEKLDKNINLYRLAFKIFKRLYFDDGYSLESLESGDVSLCIAFAPDLIPGGGMLTALKRLGELDAYIV
ncbi:MAG: hypothetical protein J1F36_04420 [Clostridiales bacterium]|nr:hypothetical protein [Clostridiales bacterium]